jgi:hypothetical protein
LTTVCSINASEYSFFIVVFASKRVFFRSDN